MKNKIEDLRNHLFETLEALKDKDHPMDLDRARVISGVAQTIINSAKAETEYLKAIGEKGGSGFIPLEEKVGDGNAQRPRLVRQVVP